MTLPQLHIYLSMLPYTNPWSEKFGKPPESPRPEMDEEDELIMEAMLRDLPPEGTFIGLVPCARPDDSEAQLWMDEYNAQT